MFANLLRNIVALVLLSFAVNLSASPALAQWPYFFGSCYGGDGYYSTYSQESVPYYALHPPVYYSHPVARTYGLFPFPYYADVPAYSSVVIEPRLVVNRFVEQKFGVEMQTASQQPLRVTNPFVKQESVDGKDVGGIWVKSTVVKTMTVYPIKLTTAK